MQVQVRAVRQGYYNDRRYKAGQKFMLGLDALGYKKDEKGKPVDGTFFLPTWTELVEPLHKGETLSDRLKGKLGRRSNKPAPSEPVNDFPPADADDAEGSSGDHDVI